MYLYPYPQSHYACVYESGGLFQAVYSSGQKKVPVPFSYYDRVTIDRVNKNEVATHAQRYDCTYSVPFLNSVRMKSKCFTVSRAQEFSCEIETEMAALSLRLKLKTLQEQKSESGCCVTACANNVQRKCSFCRALFSDLLGGRGMCERGSSE